MCFQANKQAMQALAIVIGMSNKMLGRWNIEEEEEEGRFIRDKLNRKRE